MSQPVKAIALVAAFVSSSAFAAEAYAACCAGFTQTCAGTKSVWCVQTGAPALPTAFCNYGDKVVSTLEMVFNIPAPSIFEFEVEIPNGGAHTGTACGNFGDGVTGDAFGGTAFGATGFWGYLLSLHEAINDWTGLSSPGWPTDWWADHQSAFPNMMDFHIMNTIGVANADQNLISSAAAQKARFYPGGSGPPDPKVVALDNVFLSMPNMDGYAGFSHTFAMQKGDGVIWNNLGVPNPNVKRSEYVVAYMSLAAGQSVLKTVQGPGANGGGNICNGTPDGTAGDTPYVCSQANIDAIATAHCAVAANGKRAADLTALRGGNYAAVPSGPCGGTCPNECACDSANHCVAPWLGTLPPNDGGVGVSDASASRDATTSGGGSDASSSGGSSGSNGSSGSGGSSGGSGGSGSGGITGSSSSSGAPSGPGSSGGGGSAGSGAAGNTFPSAPSSSGCSCRALGAGGDSRPQALLAISALAALVFVRARARRR